MPHLGGIKFKALHKQHGRLSMRRNQGKPGNVTRDEFSDNWDKIFGKKKKAGNYTKPTMRKRLFEKIKAGTKGGKAGQWSARKAQLLAKEYKAKGGGYK